MDAAHSQFSPPAASPRTRKSGELSYKFQRLRERLRQAIVSGELSGKLPGERQLAKRYNCNAKTLSKALTDLAAEGLLDRSIGRGTYVKGSAPAEEAIGPWLLLGDGNELEGGLLRHLAQHNPRCQHVVGEPEQRPSFVNQFAGVVDASTGTPDTFLRDLVVRGIPVVVVGREPRTYSVDSVMVDVVHGASRLARELHELGHTRFAAVEAPGHNALTDALRRALARHAGVTVDTVSPSEAAVAVAGGVTALVCDGIEAAETARRSLNAAGIDFPGRVSLTAVGVTTGEPTVTGCFVPLAEVADNVTRLLSDTTPRRPTTLWLAPLYVDRGTSTAPRTSLLSESADARPGLQV